MGRGLAGAVSDAGSGAGAESGLVVVGVSAMTEAIEFVGLIFFRPPASLCEALRAGKTKNSKSEAAPAIRIIQIKILAVLFIESIQFHYYYTILSFEILPVLFSRTAAAGFLFDQK